MGTRIVHDGDHLMAELNEALRNDRGAWSDPVAGRREALRILFAEHDHVVAVAFPARNELPHVCVASGSPVPTTAWWSTAGRWRCTACGGLAQPLLASNVTGAA